MLSSRIEKLKTTPHRLEIINKLAPYTIIDNAYNSSVEGSEASLKVLKCFDGKKFIITPGLVELGSQQFACNFDFGKRMAKICDYVIVDCFVNFDAIKQGLIDSGFEESHVIQVANLTQAVDILNTLVSPNDVVLFENDLPDNYS